MQVQALRVAVAVVCLGAGVWGGKKAYDGGRRAATQSRLAQVSLSLVTYSKVFGHLPRPVHYESGGQVSDKAPDKRGRALYSWRVELVRFLESWHGSWDPSKPWNDPANKQLSELSPFYTYDAQPPDASIPSFPETIALAITGPGTAFGDGEERPRALKDVPPSTILVVETRASGIPWPAPGDFDIRTMPHTINAPSGKGISGQHAGGFRAIFADGQLWYLSDKVPFATLEKFFTTAEAKKHDREELLGPFALKRGP